jgi:hypothetical protein
VILEPNRFGSEGYLSEMAQFDNETVPGTFIYLSLLSANFNRRFLPYPVSFTLFSYEDKIQKRNRHGDSDFSLPLSARNSLWGRNEAT